MNYGAYVKIEDVEIRMLEAKHSSTFDFEIETKYAGNPGSFLFTFDDDIKVFHAGRHWIVLRYEIHELEKSTILISHYCQSEIFSQWIRQEASIAASWINPEFVIPMHYNSFPSIAQDPEKFKKSVTNCQTLIPKVLETLEFKQNFLFL